MPDEFEEIIPAAEEPAEPVLDAADTMAGDDLAPVDGAVDVSDTMAESSFASGQGEVPGGAPMMPGAGPATFTITKPRSNIFTLLLILAFLCIGLAIYFLAHELNNYYGVTFGGILSPPNKTAGATGTEK
ncbi:MAG: hypothetical protein HZA49_05725 [Planctomycetes bacterium]|nr:hypothetical protein [Planctomycetota bacterium]